MDGMVGWWMRLMMEAKLLLEALPSLKLTPARKLSQKETGLPGVNC